MKHIVLTGGGTAGHVTPNIAMIPALKEQGFTISYIGSYNGIEKKLIEEMGIPYYGISSGKLRRYFDVKNFTDPFRVLKGFSEARKLLKKLKPDVVFSKGGFVSVPVVIAAKRCKIPAIIHESDMTPGLANKLCIPSAVKVCCNFPETVSKLPADKAVLTGTPIRQELLQGDPEAALRWIDFFYSEIGDLCSQYGADEGTDWVLNPEGKVGLNGEPAKYEVLNLYSAETQNHDWQDIGIRVAPADYRLGQAVDPDVDVHSTAGLEKLLYDASAELYAPYAGTSNIKLFDEMKLTDEESTNISVIAVEVADIIESDSVAFMTGAKDIDSEWDSFKDSLDKAGLQDLIAVYQEAYARSSEGGETEATTEAAAETEAATEAAETTAETETETAA